MNYTVLFLTENQFEEQVFQLFLISLTKMCLRMQIVAKKESETS